METRELYLCSCEDGVYWMQIIVVLTVSNAGGPGQCLLGANSRCVPGSLPSTLPRGDGTLTRSPSGHC